MKFQVIAVAFLASILVTPARSQGVTTVDAAIEKLNKLCLVSQTYAVDLSTGGEFALKDIGGRVMGLFKLSFAEILGLADKMSSEQIERDRKDVRKCMSDNLDRMAEKVAVTRDGPTIVLIDSLLAPYRKEMVAVGQTNGDDLTAALRLLAVNKDGTLRPLRIIKETAGLQWDRENEVLALKPGLVIMHFSAFESPTEKCEPSPRDKSNKCFQKFFSFTRRVVEAGIPMIIYSRIPSLCRTHRPAFVSQLSQKAIEAGRVKVYLFEMTGRNFLQQTPKEDVSELTKAILKVASPPVRQQVYCSML